MADDLPIDLSLTLDPADVWPIASDCPDWPMLLTASSVYVGRRGRAGAEEQLRSISSTLNRGRRVRQPSPEEQAEAASKYFIRGEGNDNDERLRRLGIDDLRPRSRGRDGDDARLMLEAMHIRGYLRKLDDLAAKEVQDKARRAREQDEQTVEKFRSQVERATAECSALAEAAARHRQRIDDEKAFHRYHELRKNLRAAHYPAEAAARRLGVDEPDLPSIEAI
jgi:hypothetical protein